MTLKTLILGSAIALAFATPSFAQGDEQTGPQYSTPAEHAATQNLNGQANDGTTESPAALNGQADRGQPSASQVQYEQQQQEYQAKQQEYQDSQKRYRDQQDRYRSLHIQYERNLHHYYNARFYFTDYPHASYPYRYEDRHLVRLYMIAEPSQQLSGAPVEGPDGQFIGKVRSIETAPDGRPAHVEIALNRRVSVWVEPSDLRFDADDHVVFTHLTRSDLWDMPGATYESRNSY